MPAGASIVAVLVADLTLHPTPPARVTIPTAVVTTSGAVVVAIQLETNIFFIILLLSLI